MPKQSALEAAVEPGGELTERTAMVLKFTAAIGVIDVDIRMFESNDINEAQEATARLGIMRMLTAVRRFCWRRRGLCLARLHCFISSGHLPGTCVLLPV